MKATMNKVITDVILLKFPLKIKTSVFIMHLNCLVSGIIHQNILMLSYDIDND